MSETVIQSLASLAFASGWMFHLFDQLSFCRNMFEPTAYWSEIASYGSSVVSGRNLASKCRAPCGGIWWSLSCEEAFHLSHLSHLSGSLWRHGAWLGSWCQELSHEKLIVFEDVLSPRWAWRIGWDSIITIPFGFRPVKSLAVESIRSVKYRPKKIHGAKWDFLQIFFYHQYHWLKPSFYIIFMLDFEALFPSSNQPALRSWSPKPGRRWSWSYLAGADRRKDGWTPWSPRISGT